MHLWLVYYSTKVIVFCSFSVPANSGGLPRAKILKIFFKGSISLLRSLDLKMFDMPSVQDVTMHLCVKFDIDGQFVFELGHIAIYALMQCKKFRKGRQFWKNGGLVGHDGAVL